MLEGDDHYYDHQPHNKDSTERREVQIKMTLQNLA